MKHAVKCLLAGVLICLACVSGWAQATAQIHGSVKDQSGAVLPGVEITATQTATGVARSTVTDETGSFALPNLQIGPYRLEAILPGFRSSIQTGVVLDVNSDPLISMVLQVGQVTEQVEVEANAAQVETRALGVGQVIENQRIVELPLNGRQVTDLIVLAGAAVQTGTSSQISLQNLPVISVAGGFTSATTYLLDGAIHNNPYDSLTLPLPFPDALQEFKVETSVLSAQNGLHSGATVNSVTKSGTNGLHGDAFEFVRNDLFNARQYFATKGSTLKRNQFGGTLGGPVVKNKVFFFGGYQGTTIRQDPSNVQNYIPTAAMLAGDFTAYASPLCNSGRPMTLKGPLFDNNRINPSFFSKAALNLASKLPTTTDPCGLIIGGARVTNDEKQIVGKIDYQWTDKQSFFGRFLVTMPKQSSPYDSGHNLLNSNVVGYDNIAHSYTLGHTYLLSANTINALRLTVNRSVADRINAKFFPASDIGVNIYSYEPYQTRVTATGAFTLGANWGPTRSTGYQVVDDVSLVRGTHQFALGGNLAQWRVNLNAFVRTGGNFTFSGQQTGLVLSDFLTGQVSSFQQTPVNANYMSKSYLASYIADTWRLTPRLTVNYGLRWEPNFPQVRRDGQISNFSEDRFAAKIHSTVFKNAPYGFLYPGDPGFPGSCRSTGICISAGQYTHWKNMTPRLGLAWDPRGDGKMSVRASYGMSFDILTSQFYEGFISPPWSNRIILTTPAGGFDNPWSGFPGGNPFPTPTAGPNALFLPYGSYYTMPLDNPSTARNAWNLAIQRQIGTEWTVSASYMGSQTSHIWTSRAFNAPVYIPGGPCTIGGVTYNTCSTTANEDVRRRLALKYPNIGGPPISYLDQWETGGTQSYHGMLLSVQRRAARGVSVIANYTLSHCYGDGSASETGGGGNPGVNFLDPNNRRYDRGNCEVDARHVFNSTVVAETPRFTNQKMVRAVAGGWRLSGIYRTASGTPLTILSGVDRALNGISNQRPDQILGSVYGNKSGRPLSQFINPAAFALPAMGTNGNMSPRNIQGLGTWQFDVSLSRTLQVRENQRVEIRAEAYNVTNSFRPQNPNVTLNNSAFGQIRGSYDPRLMQFALKYVF